MSLRAALSTARRAHTTAAFRAAASLPATRLAARSYTTSTATREAAATLEREQAQLERVLETARTNAANNAANGKKTDPQFHNGLRMLMFGKPASGKGTLSSRLIKSHDIAFVSTGDVLRHEIRSKSDVGRKAEKVVAAGGLVSDELMLELVKTELDRHKGKSWILDGFPRTLEQGKMLNDVLTAEGIPLNMIVNLNVPDAIIMQRITSRWVHLPSGRVYNDDFNPPKVPGKDDVTGEDLSKRPDDTPEVFSKRLQSYYKSTAPLLEYFAHTCPETLNSLSGSSSDEIWPHLEALVEPAIAHRDPELANADPQVTHTREEADDLRNSAELPMDNGRLAHVH
ncbi:uncharacterized protein EHS24_000556 [Apiotrichum porosum]|uniref:GTP:AMP phosphotransferase, mitochondrial n=1 Tax=Apiotrichum porosum TaxID=105984 RepID=A0A427YAA1_9TREE|nr:uncharacterized protein EHS24_000556 [Apiotrichum porosum]RSH88032.1 hypothetical protein EHS24_000556 [Apiotrichum porosum]